MSLATDLLKKTTRTESMINGNILARRPRRTKDSGIPHGIYLRGENRWHAREFKGGDHIHIGIFGTLREACMALANYYGCEVTQLRGLSPEVWEKVKDDQPVGQFINIRKPEEAMTLEEVNSLFEFRDGEIYWRKGNRRRNTEQPAGTLHNGGARQIKIRGKSYLASRLVWLMHAGEWPTGYVVKLRADGNHSMENLRLYQNGKVTYGRDLVKRSSPPPVC